MKTAAIIVEFNPLHNGHKYIINKTKETTGADNIIVIMSGNYVQRGEPSFIDKYTKTKVAIESGASMVLELPMPFSISSAEYFATAAVTILDKLGIVDFLVFGVDDDLCIDSNSDSNNNSTITSTFNTLLDNITNLLLNETDEFKSYIKKSLSEGNNYATSRTNALKAIYKDQNLDFLAKPNMILAIEYMKALKKINSTIKPVAIRRVNAGYHDTFSDNVSDANLFSATNFRLLDDVTLKDNLLEVSNIYDENIFKHYPVKLNNSASAVIGTLLQKEVLSNETNIFFDVSDSLYNKIKNNIDKYTDFSSFIALLKTKDISYTSISRSLLMIALGYTKKFVHDYIENSYGNYVRCLGIDNNHKHLFKCIEANSSIKIITNLKNYATVLDDSTHKYIKKNLEVENIYHLIQTMDYKRVIPNEFTQKFITN